MLGATYSQEILLFTQLGHTHVHSFGEVEVRAPQITTDITVRQKEETPPVGLGGIGGTPP
jgi:hypothetical protein